MVSRLSVSGSSWISPLFSSITTSYINDSSTMSKAGSYFKTAMSLVTALEEGKPHSSVTDWIEVLSSDRYEELSLDGISELVDSVNILGPQGTTVLLLPLYNFTLVHNLTNIFSLVGGFASYQEEAQVRQRSSPNPSPCHSASSHRECGQGIPAQLGQ